MPKKTESRTESTRDSFVGDCSLRRCEQCGYQVSDPVVTRCPRCWVALPAPCCGNCTGCSLFSIKGNRD